MQTEEFFLFDTVNTITAPILDASTMAAVKDACLRYEKAVLAFRRTIAALSHQQCPRRASQRRPRISPVHRNGALLLRSVGRPVRHHDGLRHAPMEFQKRHYTERARRTRSPLRMWTGETCT